MKTSSHLQAIIIGKFGEWVALAPFALPMLYLSPISNVFQTNLYRAAFIILCGSISLALLVQRRKSRSLRLTHWQYEMAAFMLLATVSTVLSKQPAIGIFGISADYQGLATLLSSIVLAYWTSLHSENLIFWRKAGSVMGVVCILSCVVSASDVLQGYRLAGLLMHATGVSFYAVMALGLVLVTKYVVPYKKRTAVWLQYGYIASAIVVIGFSGSRIGLIACILSLLVVGLYLPKTRKVAVASLLGLAIIASLSYGIASPAQRLTNPRRVEVGMAYRADLYRWSIQQADMSVLGVGTAQVSRVLNSPPKVTPPPSIQRTFMSGFPLWYTHSQLIDVYVEYGLLGLGLIAYIFATTYSSVWRMVRQKKRSKTGKLLPPALLAIVLLISMTLNFLINTPSIELTPILFLAIFCALRLRSPSPKKSIL